VTGTRATRGSRIEAAHAEVEVRILGPTQVRGAARPFDRPRSLELVVFLSLHPDGATTDRWATALWPERAMAPATLHSTASAARRSLGRARSGGDHLPRRHGWLRLEPSVRTDLDRLTSMAASPYPPSWQAGLALVRGRPFEGLRRPDWTVMEGIDARVQESVTGLALRLADHLLDQGDGTGAAWAARRGLLASPFDERLYRRLMRAADVQGNPAAVESTMRELALVLGGEGDEPVVEFVHPDTAALYRALSRRCSA
jgi:hypothetical protein